MTKKIRKILITVICMMICTGMTCTSAFAAGKAKEINDYRCWAQDDPRWAAVELGKSGLTVSDAGCAVVSYTKLLIQAGVRNKSFTPDQLVKWMKKNGKFCTTKGKRAQIASWEKMADISSEISYVTIEKKPSAKTVMSYIRKGNFVILKVTLKCGGDHFVTVANDASISAGKPLIWNSVKGVSSNKTVYEKYNLNKNPYSAFKSVDRAIVYRTEAAASAPTSGSAASEPASGSSATVTEPSAAEGSSEILVSTPIEKAPETEKTGETAPAAPVSESAAEASAPESSVGSPVTESAAEASVPESSVGSPVTESAASETVQNEEPSFVEQITEVIPAVIQETAEDAVNETIAYPLELKNAILPQGTIAQGSAFTISGLITSSSNIMETSVTVSDASGHEMFSASASPNADSFSLYTLDKHMTFSKLPAGSYTYCITAVDETSCQRWDGSFCVQKTDIAGKNCTYPKGTLKKGKTFSCKGTLTSASPIRQVTMSVYSTDGVKQFEAGAAPNATRFDLHSLDSKMVFRTLPCGRYIYRVTAEDSSGTVRNVISISFEVRS